MTMSKYQLECETKCLFVTIDEWSNFLNDIKTSCYFKIPLNATKGSKFYDICLIKTRSYEDSNYIYFHITNDTRRTLYRFLKENYQII